MGLPASDLEQRQSAFKIMPNNKKKILLTCWPDHQHSHKQLEVLAGSLVSSILIWLAGTSRTTDSGPEVAPDRFAGAPRASEVFFGKLGPALQVTA